MCGRITLTSSAGELAQHFELDAAASPEAGPPRYNIAPSQEILAVREDEGGRRVTSRERWGLVPHWARDPAIGYRMINARAETLATKPAFREAFRSRRCVVPADGFYEWGGAGAERRPFVFRRPDGGLFGIAGLYERWIGEGGEVIDSCTLVTTRANDTLAPFHDRMPVVLAPGDYGPWLDRRTEEPDVLLPLLAPCPPDWLQPSPASLRVNDPHNDDPGCLVPEPRTGSLFG